MSNRDPWLKWGILKTEGMIRRIRYCTGVASLPLEIDISSVMLIFSLGSLIKIITSSVGCFSVLLRTP